MPCRNHPHVESGLEHCHRCGGEFCAECRVDFEGKPHCATCKADAVAMLESGRTAGVGAGAGAGAQAGPDGGELPPWERREELGMGAAFWETIKSVMGDPERFFARLDKRATTWDCLAIPCILSVLGAIVSGIVQIAFGAAMTAFLADQMGPQSEELQTMLAGQLGGGLFGACIGVVMAPVVAVIFAFVFAGLIHLFLMMTKKVKRPYHQTMRGYCYAQAPQILTVIPILGGFVAFFWTIYTTASMVRATHDTSWGAALLASVWYWLLICVCCGGGYAMLIAAIVSQSQR